MPLADRQAAFVGAHLTPQEGEDLFQELGKRFYSPEALTSRTAPRLAIHTAPPRASTASALIRMPSFSATATGLSLNRSRPRTSTGAAGGTCRSQAAGVVCPVSNLWCNMRRGERRCSGGPHGGADSGRGRGGSWR